MDNYMYYENGLSKQVHQMILKVCRDIQNMPYEVGIWLDSRSNELYGVTSKQLEYINHAYCGRDNRGCITCRPLGVGKIFVHNHPNREISNLSTADIEFAIHFACRVVAIASDDKELNYAIY